MQFIWDKIPGSTGRERGGEIRKEDIQTKSALMNGVLWWLLGLSPDGDPQRWHSPQNYPIKGQGG